MASSLYRARLAAAWAAREAGHLDEAHAGCVAALAQDAKNPSALHLLAAIEADRGDAQAGLRWAEQAIAAAPGDAGPHYTHGRLLEIAGRLEEAEASYRRAVLLAPGDARAHNNLGGVLHMQGRLDEALACYKAALRIDPAQPQANQNYASIVRDPGAMAAAVEGYGRQAKANPRDPAPHDNLGNVHRELGQLEDAVASYERAIAAAPEYAAAHLHLAFTLLQRGELARGWEEFEWRFKLPDLAAPMRRFREPPWDGRPLPQGTLLLHAEQGLGDTLQFARYGALAAERCGQVVLECQPELKALLEGVRGYGKVVARGEPLPRFDAHLPLMSAPRVLATRLETIPWPGPYLRASPERIARRPQALEPAGARLKVGLVWAGRPEHWDDRNRSIALSRLAPLASVPGARFFSLQKGPAAAQAATPPEGMDLVDLGGAIRDFADTAAIAASLDLVISVDTSVAHLAGAMGAPTWLLLPFAPDWRWLSGRRDTPWYPSVTIFRQPADGDWDAVAGAVREALHRLRRA